jgi:hypothetical protein
VSGEAAMPLKWPAPASGDSAGAEMQPEHCSHMPLNSQQRHASSLCNEMLKFSSWLPGADVVDVDVTGLSLICWLALPSLVHIV